MASVYDKYYEQQPAAVKVIVVAAVGLLGYSIYRKFKRDEDEREALRGAVAAQSELNELANQGIHPSYDDSQFLVFVSALTDAMNGCGTDEETIYSVFENMQNEADVRKLITMFGLQYYEPCAIESPLSFALWQFNSKAYGGDLSTWLHYDLSAGDIDKINEILEGNGITYKL